MNEPGSGKKPVIDLIARNKFQQVGEKNVFRMIFDGGGGVAC